MKSSHFTWMVALLILAAPVCADDLNTLANKKISGTLEKITDSTITIKSDGQSVDTPVMQALDLTLRPTRGVTATKYLEVELHDGSLMKCTKVSFTAKEAQLELTTGLKVNVPLSALVTVLRDADDPKIRKQWDLLMTDKVRQDRVFILNKEEQLQPLKGTLGSVDVKEQTIFFKLAEGAKDLNLRLDKLQGMQFLRTEVIEKGGMCKVIDVEGNKLIAYKLAYDGSQVTVMTPFGEKVSIDPKNISMFDFNLGRLTFLSDLDEKMPDTTLLGGFLPLRKNKNLDGGDMILQDKKYEKGLSMYAGVQLEYNLNEKYKDFKAILGVDSRIAEEGQGQVSVTIFCDGEKRSTFEVSVKAPLPIAINVKDVKTLKIVVSGTNFTNYAGHAMLANAHVSQ